MEISSLPAVNACLNTLSAAWLVAGWVLVKRRSLRAHAVCMCAALVTSTLFLASYLTYHALHGSTPFWGQGALRAFYFAVLISHTALAIVIVPLIGFTSYRALRGDLARHVAIARVTLPLWLYVSVTGVVVYGMLYRLRPGG